MRNLNEENQDGNPKGYRMSDAQTLSGMLRPHPTILGTYILVKFIGYNRVWMKLLANKGKDSLVKMEVTFHEEGLSQKDYISIEAESHSTDAGNRSSQNVDLNDSMLKEWLLFTNFLFFTGAVDAHPRT